MPDHTPGPWGWWTSCSWRRLTSKDSNGSWLRQGNVLCPVVASDGHPDIIASKEDMALIEAAPDLLAALEPFADILGEDDDDFADDCSVTVSFGRTKHYALTLRNLRLARDAVLKAEGRSDA